MKVKLTLLFLFIYSIHFSQSEQQRNRIINYYAEHVKFPEIIDYSNYSMEAYRRDLKRCESQGIPTEIQLPNGNVGQFVRFDGDVPLYYTTYNLGAAVTSRANMVHPGGSLGLNLTGAGMIVGVWDQNHPRTTHSDYATRIQITDGSAVTASNHSTHVTGTILSSGASNSNGRGIAYQANGWINDWTNDTNEMSQYAGLGLLVSNHSYGLVASSLPVWFFGAYVSDSRTLDQVCFNNPKYLPVFAAGNDRDSSTSLNPSKDGNDLLAGDKTAKNALIVGAVNNVSNYTGSSSVVMSSFSNFGPTDDFRIKPDIVTKGVNVFSTTSTSNTSYGTLSGTSMAAPGVSAGLVLLQQHYGGDYMNASTLKGLVIHTADEAGPSDGPDHMFGWGLINIGKSAQVISGRGTSSFMEENVLNSGTTYTKYVLANGIEDVKVTLSWTDRAGTAVNNSLDNSSPRLVNDLDLRVKKEESTFFPWYLNKNFNDLTAKKGDNNVDNVEQIQLDNSVGVYEITVSHKGSLAGGSQDYSLIITGVDADAVLSANQNESVQAFLWKDSQNFINYQLSNDIGEFDLFIYDINGKLVEQSQGNNQSGKIDFSIFPKGVYIIKFVDKAKMLTFVKKVVI